MRLQFRWLISFESKGPQDILHSHSMNWKNTSIFTAQALALAPCCSFLKTSFVIYSPPNSNGLQPDGDGLQPKLPLLILLSQGGMRRLDATFALAPRGGGAEEFHGWLKASKHPWAERALAR